MSEAKAGFLDSGLLDRVVSEAAATPRGRKNFNFHERADHPCQRLINAVLPGSYIRAHRHLHADKSEMLVAVRGRIGLVFFDDAGNVTDTAVLDAAGDCLAVNIPNGQFHTAVALGGPAVVFEAKAGPYAPHTEQELAPFAPPEGSPEAVEYLRRMEALFDAK